MSRLQSIAGKLQELADKAEQFQLEAGTTTSDPSAIPEHLRTVRETVSIILMDPTPKQNPRFAFHREPIPKSDKYRMAVFGGGIESREEKLIRKTAEQDVTVVDPLLLDNGKIPPDLWYRYQGKRFLEDGKLPQTHFDFTPETMEEILLRDLQKRLKMEMERDTVKGIERPAFLYNAKPKVTNVMNRRIGDYTEQIAEKYGMEVVNGNLMGMMIAVHERFAVALLKDADDFDAKTYGNAVILHADELIDRAAADLADQATWNKRFERPDDPLPVRNSSLLHGSAAAAYHLAPTLQHRFANALRWIKNRTWSAAA